MTFGGYVCISIELVWVVVVIIFCQRTEKEGGERETVRRPVSQSGLETGLGLDLHSPVGETQPHPGEQEGDNWLFKNGGKSVKGEAGGVHMSDVCMCASG